MCWLVVIDPAKKSKGKRIQKGSMTKKLLQNSASLLLFAGFKIVGSFAVDLLDKVEEDCFNIDFRFRRSFHGGTSPLVGKIFSLLFSDLAVLLQVAFVAY